jgi:hypothetical protein
MAKRLNSLQRERTEVICLILGMTTASRYFFFVLTCIMLATGSDTLHRALFVFFVVYVVDKVLHYVYPKTYRSGREWRAGKSAY